MSRVSRYKEQKPQLNFKKVIGTIVLLLAIIALVFGIVYVINEGQVYRVRRNPIKHYFVSYNEDNKKYGVINASGEEVLPNQYNELILIPNKEKDVFIITEVEDYKKNKYSIKVLNENGNLILKDYEDLKPIEYNNKGIIEYDNTLLQFKKDGKIGLVAYDGTEKFKAIFDEVKTIKNIPNRLIIKEKDKYGIVNTEIGEYIVPALYKSVKPLIEDKNTPYIVQFDQKLGLYNNLGKEILPSQFDSIVNLDSVEYFKATKNKVTNIYNKEGKEIIKGDIADIISIKENIIVNKLKNKVGVIDFKKKEIIPYKYQQIIPASVDKYIVKLANKFNIRSITEEKLLEQEYNSIVFNSEAQMYIASNDSVADIYNVDLELKLNGIISNIDIEKGIIEIHKDDDFKLYNFQFEEKTEKEVYPENNLIRFKNEEGKYGYKNDKDKVIVEPIYDDAKLQNKYGYIAVSKDNKWGVLNYNGAVITDPILDLSENLVIDFIADWYYHKDLELNIYVKIKREVETQTDTNQEQTETTDKEANKTNTIE